METLGGQKPSDSGTTTNSLFLDHLNNKLCSVSLKYVKTCSKIESFTLQKHTSVK